MFCPNCGTKNAETEAKCAQCGFDLQAKAPQARFKGTMVMAPAAPAAKPNAPAPTAAAQAPAAAKGGSSLKGTMIGVAPPEMARALEEAKAKALAQAAASASAQPKPAAPTGPQASAPQPATKPSLKGTMIGIAPPDMQAAIAAAKAKISADGAPAAPTQGAPSAPAAGPAPTPAPAPAAKPSMKGTMIGVAPPDMQAAIASHKADLEKRSADAARSAGTAPTDPPPAGLAPTAASTPLARSANSKLKGTMIGVAPPDMQAAITNASAKATAAPTPRAASSAGPSAPTDFAATMVGTAAPVAESLRPTATSSRPPSGEFKGTMVGATSPLVESNDAAGTEAHGPDSRAANNSDHPAAFASTSLSAAAEIAAARANLQRVLAESDAPPKVPTGRDIPTGAQSPAAIRSLEHASKKSALPVLLLGLALVIVAVLIGFALISRAKSTAPAEPAKAPAAP